MAENPSTLRDRASRLRTCANRLDNADLFRLRRLAGVDTWIGPTAHSYREMLSQAETDISRAADDLRDAARRLIYRAELIEEEQRRAARLPIPT